MFAQRVYQHVFSRMAVPTVVISFLTIGVRQVLAQTSIWETYFSGAQQNIRQGKLTDADRLLSAALDEARKSVNEEQIEKTLAELIPTKLRLSKFDEVKPLLDELDAEVVRGHQENTLIGALLTRYKGDVAEQDRNFVRAEELFRESLKISEAQNSPLNATIATAHIARVFAAQGKNVEAEVLYQKAMAAAPQGPDSAEALVLIAKDYEVFLRSEGKNAEAEKLSTTYRVSLGLPPPEEARKSFNEGLRALSSSNLTDAIGKLDRAVSIDPSYREARINLAIAYSNRALEFSKSGQLTDAEDYYLKALRTIYNKVTGVADQEAEICERCADVLIADKKYDDAEKFCLTAINLRQQTYGNVKPPVLKSLEL